MDIPAKVEEAEDRDVTEEDYDALATDLYIAEWTIRTNAMGWML